MLHPLTPRLLFFLEALIEILISVNQLFPLKNTTLKTHTLASLKLPAAFLGEPNEIAVMDNFMKIWISRKKYLTCILVAKRPQQTKTIILER